MTDRELLELAAKAAGWTPEDGDIGFNGWDPLSQDGTALWLVVKLNLSPSVFTGITMCSASELPHDQCFCSEPHEIDPYAATRRAIVRAAAEIGKTMK